ncbi:unnamed protein product, partial [Ectocarpus sp. 4 AP-2014]
GVVRNTQPSSLRSVSRRPQFSLENINNRCMAMYHFGDVLEIVYDSEWRREPAFTRPHSLARWNRTRLVLLAVCRRRSSHKQLSFFVKTKNPERLYLCMHPSTPHAAASCAAFVGRVARHGDPGGAQPD